jgi:UDP-glucose:glycoprotein glucosyltransferase
MSFSSSCAMWVSLEMQREPKLARARKIPEWEDYDREISEFSRKLAEKGLIHSRFAAADTNALAGEVKQAAEKPSATENEPAHDTTVNRRDEL